MSKSQLLFLDSENAQFIGETSSDMIFSLNFNTGNNMDGYSLSLQSVIFPNLVYPINSNNNVFYWSEDGGALITSTINENNYKGDEIATAIQDLLNNDSGLGRTYAVTYDSQSKKLKFTESVGLPNTFEFYSGTNDIFREIGIIADGSSKSTSFICDYPIDITGSEYVDIQTDISSNNYSSNGKSNILDRIPILVNFGDIVFYQNTTDDYISLSEDTISTLQIRLLDDDGNLWKLPQNAKVSIVCKLSII